MPAHKFEHPLQMLEFSRVLLIFYTNFSFITFSMLALPNCQVPARSDFSEERYDFLSQRVLNYGK